MRIRARVTQLAVVLIEYLIRTVQRNLKCTARDTRSTGISVSLLLVRSPPSFSSSTKSRKCFPVKGYSYRTSSRSVVGGARPRARASFRKVSDDRSAKSVARTMSRDWNRSFRFYSDSFRGMRRYIDRGKEKERDLSFVLVVGKRYRVNRSGKYY